MKSLKSTLAASCLAISIAACSDGSGGSDTQSSPHLTGWNENSNSENCKPPGKENEFAQLDIDRSVSNAFLAANQGFDGGLCALVELKTETVEVYGGRGQRNKVKVPVEGSYLIYFHSKNQSCKQACQEKNKVFTNLYSRESQENLGTRSTHTKEIFAKKVENQFRDSQKPVGSWLSAPYYPRTEDGNPATGGRAPRGISSLCSGAFEKSCRLDIDGGTTVTIKAR